MWRHCRNFTTWLSRYERPDYITSELLTFNGRMNCIPADSGRQDPSLSTDMRDWPDSLTRHRWNNLVRPATEQCQPSPLHRHCMTRESGHAPASHPLWRCCCGLGHRPRWTLARVWHCVGPSRYWHPDHLVGLTVGWCSVWWSGSPWISMHDLL